MNSKTRVILVAVALLCIATAIWIRADRERPRAGGLRQDGLGRVTLSGPALPLPANLGAARSEAGAVPGATSPGAETKSETPTAELLAKERSAIDAELHMERVRRNAAPADRWASACNHLVRFEASRHAEKARAIAKVALIQLEEASYKKLVNALDFALSPERVDDLERGVDRSIKEFCASVMQGPRLPRSDAACRKFDEWLADLNEPRPYTVVVRKATARPEESALVDCTVWCEAPDLFASIGSCGETFTTEVEPNSNEASWQQEFEVPWAQSCQQIQVSLCDEEPSVNDCLDVVLRGRYAIAALHSAFQFGGTKASLVIGCPECSPKEFMPAAFNAARVPEDPCTGYVSPQQP